MTLVSRVWLTCDACMGHREASACHQFGLDGEAYEIDLCDRHSQALHEAFAGFVRGGRRLDRQYRRSTPDQVASAAQTRAWAKSMGLKVGQRGRLPASLVERYQAAHR